MILCTTYDAVEIQCVLIKLSKHMYSARPTLLTDTLAHVKQMGDGTQREGDSSALTYSPFLCVAVVVFLQRSAVILVELFCVSTKSVELDVSQRHSVLAARQLVSQHLHLVSRSAALVHRQRHAVCAYRHHTITVRTCTYISSSYPFIDNHDDRTHHVQ